MIPPGALRAAVFASVSTPQQASSEKDSLPSQLRDGQAWAESVGGQVVATCRVPGHSRKYIFYQEAEGEAPPTASSGKIARPTSFLSVFARHGASDSWPRWSTHRHGREGTPSERTSGGPR